MNAASNTELTTNIPNIPNIPQPVIVKLTAEISFTQNLLKISLLSLDRFFNNTKRAHTKQAAKNSVHIISINQSKKSKMSRKTETKGFKGGFIPPKLKTNESRSRK